MLQREKTHLYNNANCLLCARPGRTKEKLDPSLAWRLTARGDGLQELQVLSTEQMVKKTGPQEPGTPPCNSELRGLNTKSQDRALVASTTSVEQALRVLDAWLRAGGGGEEMPQMSPE